MVSLFATIVFVLLLIFLSFSSHGEAAPTYISHYCDNITSFTPNSTYQANIRTLLSSLSSHSNSSTNGFYNTTAGRDPDLVYGTFLCRGDVSADLCRKCVEIASNDIARRCVTEKLGVIWYDECTVRYSDQNIFSIIREVPWMDISSSESIQGDKDGFNQLLSSVMKSLMNRVAYDDQSGKRFATGEANFTRLQTLYSLVQCTPDLTDALCFRCLQSAIASIPMCCDGKQGGRVLLPSCNIRYDMSPFYRLNGTAAVVLPSPSLPNSTKQGKRKTSLPIIIAIVAPVVTSLVLLALGLLVLRKKARKKYNAVPEENELGFRRIVVEGDSLSVIKKVNCNIADKSIIAPIIHDIKEAARNLESVSFCFARREANNSVHVLARDGRFNGAPMYWIEEAPMNVVLAAKLDRRRMQSNF
ncbi:hypothetical protein V6N12_063032 [Hibiscus sabdariffa]|uniref:Gnk2-homologous domain-containing protein n=1 Tax=Hibiscus sabdariffa TaxID=183260 RepID=A0ABR2FAJ4_9ROSI